MRKLKLWWDIHNIFSNESKGSECEFEEWPKYSLGNKPVLLISFSTLMVTCIIMIMTSVFNRTYYFLSGLFNFTALFITPAYSENKSEKIGRPGTLWRLFKLHHSHSLLPYRPLSTSLHNSAQSPLHKCFWLILTLNLQWIFIVFVVWKKVPLPAFHPVIIFSSFISF